MTQNFSPACALEKAYPGAPHLLKTGSHVIHAGLEHNVGWPKYLALPASQMLGLQVYAITSHLNKCLKFFYFMHMNIFACMCVWHHIHVWYQRRSEEGIALDPLELKFIDHGEPTGEC